jgi:fanconi anemia group M protein
VAALQADFERVILIIEGDLQLLYSAFSADAIRSAIAFLAATKGVTVLQTPNAEETAALIRSMARQARKGQGYERAFRSGKPRVNPGTVFLVEGLPGIGPRRARQLLDRFGTPAAIMRATPSELTQVSGIGPKRAQQIWDALNASYQA